MKHLIEGLNKAFENRLKLGTMSVLMVNDWVEFGELKRLLDATDGNLSSHLSALVKKEYIEVQKQFVKNKPNTSYRATKFGKVAFEKHLDALEKLLKSNR